MGSCRRFFIWFATLTLLITGSTIASAALPEPGASCVRLVGESSESFAITIGPRCDLREATRLFPQIDPQSHRALPMQEQLRSIFAMNEARFAEGQLKTHTVGRACVPTGQAPDSATAEELEICPRGLVNYFGVASQGNVAVIQVPKARILTQAQRLDAVARSACGALAGLPPSSQKGASADKAQEALTGCQQVLGTDAVAAPAIPAPSEEPPVAGVKSLTLELEGKQKRIEQLERAASMQWSAPATDGHGTYAILFLVAVALLGGAFAWLRYRNNLVRAASVEKRIPAPAGSVVVDKDMLARAMQDIDRSFKVRLEQERFRYEQELDQQRGLVQELEDKLQRRAAEPAPEPTRRKASREREEQLQAELARVQQTHLAEMIARDEQIAQLEQARDGIERQLAGQTAELLKHQKREVSLRTRLTAARQKSDRSTLPPKRPNLAGAGGLPAPRAGAGFAAAVVS